MEAVATYTSTAEVLVELLRQGRTLDVRTRTDVLDRGADSTHSVTYADKLLVLGSEPLTPELREAVRAHRDELLAAACVIRPPVRWLKHLVGRYKEGWVPLKMLAANVAAFMGLHPKDGVRLESMIWEALDE